MIIKIKKIEKSKFNESLIYYFDILNHKNKWEEHFFIMSSYVRRYYLKNRTLEEGDRALVILSRDKNNKMRYFFKRKIDENEL